MKNKVNQFNNQEILEMNSLKLHNTHICCNSIFLIKEELSFIANILSFSSNKSFPYFLVRAQNCHKMVSDYKMT